MDSRYSANGSAVADEWTSRRGRIKEEPIDCWRKMTAYSQIVPLVPHLLEGPAPEIGMLMEKEVQLQEEWQSETTTPAGGIGEKQRLFYLRKSSLNDVEKLSSMSLLLLEAAEPGPLRHIRTVGPRQRKM